MNEERIQGKKPDEIYCPSCAKPIKKDAVVCPNCGVQVKEMKISGVAKPLTPEEEEVEGRAQLGGIIIYNWYVVVVLAISLLAILSIIFITMAITSPMMLKEGEVAGAGAIAASGIVHMIIWIFVLGIVMAPHIISLIGIAKRRPHAVPFIRAILIMAMIGFPIHTIIGILLWRRINHSLARKYLNYGI